MSTQRLIWNEDYRFTAIDSWERAMQIDGRREGGPGMKPSDLLPISLASCIGFDIVNVLRKKRQKFHAFEAIIESEQDPDPPWTFRSISVRFVVRGDVDPVQARKAMDLGEEKYCSISATLRPVVDLSFDIAIEP